MALQAGGLPHYFTGPAGSIFLIDGVDGGDEGGVDVDPSAVFFEPDLGEVAAVFSASVLQGFNDAFFAVDQAVEEIKQCFWGGESRMLHAE